MGNVTLMAGSRVCRMNRPGLLEVCAVFIVSIEVGVFFLRTDTLEDNLNVSMRK